MSHESHFATGRSNRGQTDIAVRASVVGDDALRFEVDRSPSFPSPARVSPPIGTFAVRQESTPDIPSDLFRCRLAILPRPSQLSIRIVIVEDWMLMRKLLGKVHKFSRLVSCQCARSHGVHYIGGCGTESLLASTVSRASICSVVSVIDTRSALDAQTLL